MNEHLNTGKTPNRFSADATSRAEPPWRVGQGYDVHALVPGRRLVLAGVQVPSEVGLLGHSDADVLAHAVIDALFGAAGLGDIGRHFPDTDARFRGADSLTLMAQAVSLVWETGYQPSNVDATVIAQKPRLAPYVEQMTANLAHVLGLSPKAVNVKAKTNERLGFEGRSEGIVAQAVVMIVRSDLLEE